MYVSAQYYDKITTKLEKNGVRQASDSGWLRDPKFLFAALLQKEVNMLFFSDGLCYDTSLYSCLLFRLSTESVNPFCPHPRGKIGRYRAF